MTLQIRRGTDGSRSSVTPSAGELLYTTDTKQLYVGDGSTAGGVRFSDLAGDTTPQLGGPLDANGFTITTGVTNGNLTLAGNGTGFVVMNSDTEFVGNITSPSNLVVTTPSLILGDPTVSTSTSNLYLVKNTYSSTLGSGMTFAQHHATADAVNFNFYKTRGNSVTPTTLQNGDDIADIGFVGHDGTNPLSGAAISVTVEGAVSTGSMPTKFSFATNNGSSAATRAELSSTGIWKVNEINNLSGSTLTLSSSGSVVIESVVFSSSTMQLPVLSTIPGSPTAGMMAVCDGVSWNGGGDGLQHLMVYINTSWSVAA